MLQGERMMLHDSTLHVEDAHLPGGWAQSIDTIPATSPFGCVAENASPNVVQEQCVISQGVQPHPLSCGEIQLVQNIPLALPRVLVILAAPIFCGGKPSRTLKDLFFFEEYQDLPVELGQERGRKGAEFQMSQALHLQECHAQVREQREHQNIPGLKQDVHFVPEGDRVIWKAVHPDGSVLQREFEHPPRRIP